MTYLELVREVKRLADLHSLGVMIFAVERVDGVIGNAEIASNLRRDSQVLLCLQLLENLVKRPVVTEELKVKLQELARGAPR